MLAQRVLLWVFWISVVMSRRACFWASSTAVATGSLSVLQARHACAFFYAPTYSEIFCDNNFMFVNEEGVGVVEAFR